MTKTNRTHLECVSGVGVRCGVKHRTNSTADRHAERLNRRYRNSFPASGYPTGPTPSGYYEPQEVITW